VEVNKGDGEEGRRGLKKRAECLKRKTNKKGTRRDY